VITKIRFAKRIPKHAYEPFQIEHRRNDYGEEMRTTLDLVLDRPAVSTWREARPSWKHYGAGTQFSEIRVNKDGSLDIKAGEHPDTNRGGKEVSVEVSPIGAEALFELIGIALGKIKPDNG